MPELMKTCLFLFFAVSALQAADPAEIPLWPDGPPEAMTPPSEATKEFRRTKGGKSVISDIHSPTITLFKPAKPNGTAVVVAPGGGYVFLSAVHEGSQVCEWLASIGVTGVLLKYRTPTRDDAAPHAKPVQDAAKAIAWLREHAAEHSLMPDRIGLLGFSAGGNLLAHLACDRGEVHERPKFGIMIYGGGFVDSKEPTKLKAGFTVPADAPPMFIACASDDGQNPIASTVLYLELKKQNIPAELHLYSKGGHGFGIRANNQPINAWPARVQEWMNSNGWFSRMTALQGMIEERKQNLKKITKLIKLGVGPFICENDFDQIKEWRQQASELRKASKVAEAQALEKKANVMELRVRDEDRKLVKPEALIADIERLKQEIAELEAELDSLFKSQR